MDSNQPSPADSLTQIAPNSDVSISKSSMADETIPKVNEAEIIYNDPIPFMRGVFPMIFSAGQDYFGLGLLSPLLPSFIDDQLDVSPAWIGFVTCAQYLGVLVGGLIFGRVSDIYGRKAAIQIACIGDIIFFTATGFVQNVVQLLIIRFAAGLFTPLVPSISWVIDSGRGNPAAIASYMGIWAMLMSMSFMLGAIVGGLLGGENWTIAHSISGGAALCALVVVSNADTPPRPDENVKPRGVDFVLQAREYWGLIAMNVVVGAAFTGGIIAAQIILVIQLGATSLEMALFFVGTSIEHAIINFVLLPYSVKKYGSTFPAMRVSLYLTVVTYIIMCFDFAYDNFVGTCFVLTISTSLLPIFMTAANIISGQYADKYSENARGVVLGFSRLAFNVGQVLGPIVATTAITYGSNMVYFATSAAVAMVAFHLWTMAHFQSLTKTFNIEAAGEAVMKSNKI